MEVDLPFNLPEKNEFGDDGFGILGRALAVATEFEKNCVAYSSICHLKQVRKEDYNLFSNKEAFNSFVEAVWKKTLEKHIDSILTRNGIKGDLKGILTKGRKARNFIAHEAGIGFTNQDSSELDSDKGRLFFKETISPKIIELANANMLVMILSYTDTKQTEYIPSLATLRQYPDKVLKWVIDVEE